MFQRRVRVGLHADDDHAALGLVVVVVLSTFFVTIVTVRPSFVGDWKLQPRMFLVPPSFFLFTAADLLNDPRLEHQRPPVYGLQYRIPGVKYVSFQVRIRLNPKHRSVACPLALGSARMGPLQAVVLAEIDTKFVA